ncbi:uncharacterized protein CANTADRAFT_281551 [Suhomyces tanzawaensis NRRL Y-17324]|uniref:Uncharacterized protein n=1 Tax=Suhomyces tanzawaensis NRRL Y-17324 TaxID=984487 RepID=A0A1E4SE55_9ASCO|nr:uncharacterized protein CANTADRAFT_281551 [Suhomyces tanzawaensis NRRL Y-17324]ODV77785.1 hypothetical protein CANTADRAFT_281551 [Suhomyces tanzawaensis NRRL Y-17324]
MLHLPKTLLLCYSEGKPWNIAVDMSDTLSQNVWDDHRVSQSKVDLNWPHPMATITPTSTNPWSISNEEHPEVKSLLVLDSAISSVYYSLKRSATIVKLSPLKSPSEQQNSPNLNTENQTHMFKNLNLSTGMEIDKLGQDQNIPESFSSANARIEVSDVAEGPWLTTTGNDLRNNLPSAISLKTSINEDDKSTLELVRSVTGLSLRRESPYTSDRQVCQCYSTECNFGEVYQISRHYMHDFRGVDYPRFVTWRLPTKKSRVTLKINVYYEGPKGRRIRSKLKQFRTKVASLWNNTIHYLDYKY